MPRNPNDNHGVHGKKKKKYNKNTSYELFRVPLTAIQNLTSKGNNMD